ncbi:MAG: 7-cyano-7-deazaguanine synthase QueC [Oscillatoriales cyanobacterium SM2_2_1]|nr:7-cyano-7-deazaguanine synthase QueC [Oscillatoriales cyanobacterium SM2_2_1]
MAQRAVVLLSGGLDSATVLAQAIADGAEPIALSFAYGQRHVRELESVDQLIAHYHLAHTYRVTVDLSQWGGSALTDATQPVPVGGVNPNIIPSTYVPGRNTVFLAIALSLAESQGASAIYLGINAVDYSGYPDCRPEYLAAYERLAQLASRVGLEGRAPRLVAPLIQDSKVEIVRRAVQLGVPIALTYSCYQGLPQPCGVCDACRIRDRALRDAGHPELATVLEI